LDSFGWEVLDHPQYSPYLAPRDYHPFLPLPGKRYSDDDDVKTEVISWLAEEAASFYTEVTLKLVERCDECYNKLGNYAVR
jgi:histone-lysine N-methyltransferase SETMAR